MPSRRVAIAGVASALLVIGCSAAPPVDRSPGFQPVPGAPPPRELALAAGEEAPGERAAEGPPPAVKWTFHVPPVAGRAWMTRRFAVLADGTGTWEVVGGEGDGEVDEELRPVDGGGAPIAGERCRGRVDPEVQRRLGAAARKALGAGCAGPAPPRALPGTISLSIEGAGPSRSCAIPGSGGSYAAFEALRTEVVAAICRRQMR